MNGAIEATHYMNHTKLIGSPPIWMPAEKLVDSDCGQPLQIEMESLGTATYCIRNDEYD